MFRDNPARRRCHGGGASGRCRAPWPRPLLQRRDHDGSRQRRRLVAEHHQAFDAARPADAGRRRPAQLGDQPVIAAAAQHGALGAEMAGHELEGGMGVVVEAAHQAGIDLERHAGRRETVLHRREEIPACLVQVVGEGGRIGVDRLVALVLAVQDAQRIALQAVARVLGKPARRGRNNSRPAPCDRRRGSPDRRTN